MNAIVIKRSSLPEPAFVIPGNATPDDIGAALDALDTAGLVVEVVPLEVSDDVPTFHARVLAFAREAAEVAR